MEFSPEELKEIRMDLGLTTEQLQLLMLKIEAESKIERKCVEPDCPIFGTGEDMDQCGTCLRVHCNEHTCHCLDNDPEWLALEKELEQSENEVAELTRMFGDGLGHA